MQTSEKVRPAPRPRPADTSARVYDILRERAITYDLRPGTHVNEAALAAELHVSRTPVRAALNRLASEGLMTIVPNKGFFRQPLDIDVVRSLFEVRMAMEVLAVRLVCERAPQDEIAAIREDWNRIRPKDGDAAPERVVEADEAFHLALARASRNKELLRLLGELNGRIRFIRTVAMERPRFRDGSIVDHNRILDAVEARDADAAADLMSQHIRLTLDDVTVLVREMVVRIYLGEPALAAQRES
jgi:DNA-binding GntR family transcriptional regulator